MKEILGRDTKIEGSRDDPGYSNYVLEQDRIGVSGGFENHDDLAIQEGLHDGFDSRGKPLVGDGGLVVDMGDRLKIAKYKTSSCRIKDYDDFNELRRKTAQLFANTKQVPVDFVKADGTVETVHPSNL